jgi:CDP-diacylglycerol--serine O-phosphatidyltransferase
MSSGGGGKEFLGFPIPAAAGLVASLTLFLMWDEDRTDLSAGPWRYLLPGLLLFLSFMMVSEVKYPSFKTLDLRARRTFAKTVLVIIFIAALVFLRRLILPVVLPLLFTLYLLYGFVRPRISRKVRDEIEEEDEEDGGASPH